jgi:mycothiol synthase
VLTMLPDGYTLRPSTTADVVPAQALLDAVESASAGEPRRGEFEVAIACRDARLDLATNTWVVEALGGELVGFVFLFWGESAQGEAEPFVHPDHRGRGVGEALLDAVETRAAELAGAAPPETAPRLHVFCAESKARRRESLLGRGFRAVRESYLMRIDLPDGPIDTAPLPAGIDVRPFAPGRDEEAVFAADEEAYAGHFLHQSSTLAQWRAHTVELAAFDPSLWLVGWSGDEVAGEALTFLDEEEAYVDSLAVREAWRGQGLGLALLTRAFALAQQRGRRKVRLGVDAQNPTGALALYLKAGMRIERREEVYAKGLR